MAIHSLESRKELLAERERGGRGERERVGEGDLISDFRAIKGVVGGRLRGDGHSLIHAMPVTARRPLAHPATHECLRYFGKWAAIDPR